ncbi:MAG: carbohydrate ABC transporter permease, partial [Ruminiclostridium sp.]|nr:carbohydrate ABC transporter permease [Ruminiclostridium sp.]
MVKHRRTKDRASSDYVISNFAGPFVKWGLLISSLAGVIFPLYWLALSAFKLDRDHRSYPPVFFPSEFTLDHFIEVFTKNQLLQNLINSATISVVTTVITLLVGSMAAYAVQRGPLGRKTKDFFGLWFMVQKMYPAIATAIPVYLVMRSLRLIDSLAAMIIMNTSFNLPLVIWLMMGFFEQVPYELEESAMLDGSGFVHRFFNVVLPITKPGLVASAILTFTATWNEFLFAVILSINKAKTL